MSGTITGGWGFVFAAYGITMAVLAFYTISVFVRLAGERKRQQAETREVR